LFSNGDLIWKSHVDKFAKLVIDSGNRYTLKTGNKLALGSNYSLQAKQVDVDGKKVWLELEINGQYVDDAIVSTDSGDHTRACILNKIQGVNNVPVFKVHVNRVYQDEVDSVVQIDGLWLIDFTNAKTIKVGDMFGFYKLIQINSGINGSNLGTLIFRRTFISSSDRSSDNNPIFSQPT